MDFDILEFDTSRILDHRRVLRAGKGRINNFDRIELLVRLAAEGRYAEIPIPKTLIAPADSRVRRESQLNWRSYRRT